jgi:hypothetical protein
VFVSKLNSSGSALIYSTYLGGNTGDTGVGIALDSVGDAYVTGYTLSSDFPTTAGAFQTSLRGAQNAFITKLPLAKLPLATFAGKPGKPNCHGQSVSALSNQYGSLTAAASALGFPNVQALQDAIRAFCRGHRRHLRG